MHSDPDRVTSLCLYPDYGADFPITLDGGYCDEEDVDFSDALRHRLRAWNDLFQFNYSPWTGWTSDDARDEFLSQSPELIEAVRREVPTGVTFSVHIFFAPEYEENMDLP